MSRTLPQIIMLNHGMWYNHEKAGLNDNLEDAAQKKTEVEAASFNGKPLGQLSMQEMMAYYGRPDSKIIDG